MGVTPRSASDRQWSSVAREHPEFFLVTERQTTRLAFRFYCRKDQPDRLRIEDVQQLVQNAMALHERQVKRSEIWKTWGTLILAFVAALSGVLGLWVKGK